MSLSGAMNVGVTGLSSNAEAITVVGNNIANVNTVGFKEGRTIFSDMLSANINAGQVGRGGQIQAVQNIFSQGSFENTSSGNDLAIQGDAMFVVQDANGSQYFTRAGAFDYNKSNILTNPDGLQVMGYGINATNGLSNGVLGAIDKTAFATLLPNPTSKASMVLNLDSTQTLPGSSPTTLSTISGTIDTATAMPAGTVGIPAFKFRDEYGNLLTATVTLTHTAAQNWGWKADIGSAVPATSTVTGTLVFSAATGALVSQTPSTAQTINLSNGSKPLTTSFDFSGLVEGNAAAVLLDPSIGIANGITSSKIRLDGTIDTVAGHLPVLAANAISQNIIDANGASHAMLIEFFGSGNTLSWTMDTVDSAGVRTTNLITGTVTFDGATGLLKSFTQDKNTVTFGALAAQPLIVDFSGLTQTTSAVITTPALAKAAITPTAQDVFNPASPTLTSNFATSTTLYDTQGNAHTAKVYFVKTSANNWDWHAVLPDATGGSPINGTLIFDSNGILTTQTPSATGTGSRVMFGGGVTVPQTITFDFGTDITTQLASSSVVSTMTQDGYATGKLMSTNIDNSGYVTATFSNNQNKRISQVALARFPALGGLEKSGNSLYINTTKSGTPLAGTATDFGIKVLSNSLEQSNVDMANQLVNMIKLQRAYSGNSKTITSADEMMQETLGLKR